MFGNNIKVHFAGCEQCPHTECILEGGAKYGLFSVFGLIAGKFGIKCHNDFLVKDPGNRIEVLKKQTSDFNHTIMDSGLFTLMFGAKAGKRDAKFITAWTEELCSYVRANGITATCVEVDCQKVLGVEEAWKMRKRMKKLLPNNRIINVFHMEDGRKGLDRLIEYADYIALSVPELRRHYGFGEAHMKAVVRLANYVKQRKPSIDIHLLGCTVTKLLSLCDFCTSADSTSWQSINRYGYARMGGKVRGTANMSKKAVSDIGDRLARRFAERFGVTKFNRTYYARYVISVMSCLRDYERAAGDQS